jgi:hypothetical protein
MAEEQHSDRMRRISSRELRYPVLIIRRSQLLEICHKGESLPCPEGLLVDIQGLVYQLVAIDDSPLRRATRAERQTIRWRSACCPGALAIRHDPPHFAARVELGGLLDTGRQVVTYV